MELLNSFLGQGMIAQIGEIVHLDVDKEKVQEVMWFY